MRPTFVLRMSKKIAHQNLAVTFERHSSSFKIACLLREGSNQPVHPPSLMKVVAGHLVGSEESSAPSGGQCRQAGLAEISLYLVGNAVSRLSLP